MWHFSYSFVSYVLWKRDCVNVSHFCVFALRVHVDSLGGRMWFHQLVDVVEPALRSGGKSAAVRPEVSWVMNTWLEFFI